MKRNVPSRIEPIKKLDDAEEEVKKLKNGNKLPKSW